MQSLLAAFIFLLAVMDFVRTESLAIVLAGLPRGTNETAADFHRAILRPIRAANINVDVYAAVHRADTQLWLDWLQLANVPNPTITYTEDEVIVPAAQSYFSTCANPGNIESYHAQYSKLEVAFRAVERSGKPYDWVMKARNDYIYHPRQAFKPCWLRELPENVILATDKEPHRMDRWNQDGRAKKIADFMPEVRFPVLTSDAMYTGRFNAMRRLLTIDSTPPRPVDACLDPRLLENLLRVVAPDDPPVMIQIEHRVADHVFRQDIIIVATSFQANNEGRGQGWLDTPCLICFHCAHHD